MAKPITTAALKKLRSLIAWTHYTVNFWWGCTEVSPACANCYARTMAKMFSKSHFGFLVKWGKGEQRGERLDKATAECQALNAHARENGTRWRIFINSMSDWLDEEAPTAWLYRLLRVIWQCPHLNFQLLTKRPENFLELLTRVLRFAHAGKELEFAQWIESWLDGKAPANVWIGTTVENQHYADQRIPHLLKIPATVRFLSCEPLLGPVNIFHDGGTIDRLDAEGVLDDIPFDRSNPFRLHQIITGGEQGGKSRPMHLQWVRSLRDQCQYAGVPFFFKQWGDYLPVGQQTPEPLTKDKYKGHQWEDHTRSLRVTTPIAGALLDGQPWQQFPT
jgi:protein gp37